MAQVGPVPKLALNVDLVRKDMKNFLKQTNKYQKGVSQLRDMAMIGNFCQSLHAWLSLLLYFWQFSAVIQYIMW